LRAVQPRRAEAALVLLGLLSLSLLLVSAQPTSAVSPGGTNNIFTFQPPTQSGGDKPVSLSDFASHGDGIGEWLEAKIVPSNSNGWIWYIHADFQGATDTMGRNWVNVTTHSDPKTYPQGTASYNVQTHLLTFTVTSIPSGEGWYYNARPGDIIECYPFSTKAFWGSGSNFYWSGNCQLKTKSGLVSGVGDFIKTWLGGRGINGAPLPTCYPNTNFEAVFSIVSTAGTIDINDLLCSGIPRYQVGGILWFDNGGWEDIGTTEGKGAIRETPLNGGCTEFTISVPTTRGELTADVAFDRYLGGGCLGEDGSLSGTVFLKGVSYPILGIMSEFRCVPGYC